jgi:hypothetical protein
MKFDPVLEMDQYTSPGIQYYHVSKLTLFILDRTSSNLLQVVPRKLIQAVRNRLLLACCHFTHVPLYSCSNHHSYLHS